MQHITIKTLIASSLCLRQKSSGPVHPTANFLCIIWFPWQQSVKCCFFLELSESAVVPCQATSLRCAVMTRVCERFAHMPPTPIVPCCCSATLHAQNKEWGKNRNNHNSHWLFLQEMRFASYFSYPPAEKRGFFCVLDTTSAHMSEHTVIKTPRVVREKGVSLPASPCSAALPSISDLYAWGPPASASLAKKWPI